MVILTLIDVGVYWAADYSDLLPTQIMFLGPVKDSFVLQFFALAHLLLFLLQYKSELCLQSLASMMVYIWSRRMPGAILSFLGLFTFEAPYLPWVLMGFGLLLGHSPTHDLLGIVVGHLYYFLEDVYPAQTGRRLLRTPKVYLLFGFVLL